MSTLLLSHKACLDHVTPPGHPERSDRLRAVEEALSNERFQFLVRDQAPEGDLDLVTLCHNEHYVTELRHIAPTSGQVYVDGAFNILTKPEFANRDKLRKLFQMLEEKSRLVKILNECLSNDPIKSVKVTIGHENLAPSLKQCSVITASYELHGNVSGTVGVVVP